MRPIISKEKEELRTKLEQDVEDWKAKGNQVLDVGSDSSMNAGLKTWTQKQQAKATYRRYNDDEQEGEETDG